MSHLQPEAMHQEITSQPALPLEDSAFSVCSCSSCGKGMALRDVRDYGLPEDMPRQVHESRLVGMPLRESRGGRQGHPVVTRALARVGTRHPSAALRWSAAQVSSSHPCSMA